MKDYLCSIFILLLSLLCCPCLLSADVVGYCSEGTHIDCNSVCGGPDVHDVCGVCAGPGVTYFDTQQAGSVGCCPLDTPKGEGPPNDCGICGGVADGGKDECGVCFGPGKTSYNTAQAGSVACCAPDTYWPEGEPNDCGICGASANQGKDACGECGGPGKTSYNTAQAGTVQCCAPGTYWPEGVPNDCGICGGTADQGKDVCGVCNGPGKTSYNTAQVGVVQCCAPGTPGAEGTPNDCGVCGGSANQGKDQCGVCFGGGKTVYNTAQAGSVACCAPGTPLAEGVPNDCGICGAAANAGKDCAGTCGGSAVDLGCGCNQPGPSGCDNQCGSTATNVGCGCGVPIVNGCCSGQVNNGCGCGVTCPPPPPPEPPVLRCVYRLGTTSNGPRKPGGPGSRNVDAPSGSCFKRMLRDMDDDRDYLGGLATGWDVGKSYYYDQNCDSLGKNPDLDGTQICGTATYAFNSPISLLLNGNARLSSTIEIRRFPLGQSDERLWYEWRASETQPLLVFDPEHRGVITSSSQLFGSWTFGGKPVASLAGQSDSVAPREWTSGYEALATLDLDNSGRIEDAELAPLALWFDRNKDAISQPGEVVSVTEFGLLSLGYEVTRTDDVTGNLYSSAGFILKDSTGTIQSGYSVDWFVRGSEDYWSLAFPNGLTLPEMDASVLEQFELLAKAKSGAQTAADDEKISGIWYWEAMPYPESMKNAPSGVLKLVEGEGSVIKGATMVMMEVPAPKAGQPKFISTLAPIRGMVERAESGEVTLHLKAYSPGVTQSEVSFSLEDDYLIGESWLSATPEGTDYPEVRYKWEGVRVK